VGGSPIYGSYGDLFTYAMETGRQLCNPKTCVEGPFASVVQPVNELPQLHAAGSYYRPEGFALGQLGDFPAQAEHIVDDASSTEPNNVAQRVQQFVAAAQKMAEHIEGNDIMSTMGGKDSPDVSECLAPCISIQRKTYSGSAPPNAQDI
jgi:hypothetical protein